MVYSFCYTLVKINIFYDSLLSQMIFTKLLGINCLILWRFMEMCGSLNVNFISGSPTLF